jgi:hypothetical protein
MNQNSYNNEITWDMYRNTSSLLPRTAVHVLGAAALSWLLSVKWRYNNQKVNVFLGFMNQSRWLQSGAVPSKIQGDSTFEGVNHTQL